MQYTVKFVVKDFLPAFGAYQEAMTDANCHLFHSRLSFCLNSKMLHPLEVIDATVEAWQKNASSIEIQQIEGFVRQVLSWREYMRGIYWALMPDLATVNYFDHRAGKINKIFYGLQIFITTHGRRIVVPSAGYEFQLLGRGGMAE